MFLFKRMVVLGLAAAIFAGGIASGREVLAAEPGISNSGSETAGSDSDHGIKKIMKVFGRGLLNAVTIPLEIPRTFSEEKEKYPKAWPFSYLPKLTGNIMVRGLSAVHDAVLYPFYVNFKDDALPLTRSGNLPDYPWQKKDERKSPERLIVTSSRG